MKTFIFKIFEFSFITVTITILILGIFIHKVGFKNSPAMNFTDSYSYNEKLLFIKHQSSKPEVLSIGSSITLRNLHSEIIVNELHTDKYLNTASWGIKMNEAFYLLKLLDNIYDIDKVIIASNLADFQDGTKIIDYNFIKAYLSNDKAMTFFYFLKNFNLKYYITNIDYANYVRTNKHNNEYLNYDHYGMAGLKKQGFNIVQKNWLYKYLIIPSETAYSYLDSISNYCQSKNMKLYFFESPHREGLVKEFSLEEKELLEHHIKRIENIIEDKHYFVNSSGCTWNDSLFVDGTHLSESGAKLFTQYCFDQIKARTHNTR